MLQSVELQRVDMTERLNNNKLHQEIKWEKKKQSLGSEKSFDKFKTNLWFYSKNERGNWTADVSLYRSCLVSGDSDHTGIDLDRQQPDHDKQGSHAFFFFFFTNAKVRKLKIIFPGYLYAWITSIPELCGFVLLSSVWWKCMFLPRWSHLALWSEVDRAGRRRQWHPTPVLLLGKSHGQRSLVGCSPWGC